MGKQVYSPELDGPIDLRDPFVAAVLAWLVPGLGHIYQRRTGKGILFCVCVLGTFFYGLFLGEGRVVYASWRPEHRRLHFILQAGVGGPCLPAVVQSMALNRILPQLAAEPLAYAEVHQRLPLGAFMAPPLLEGELDGLNLRLNRFFELGTVFTLIAGLLNILAIYDAFGGPAYYEEEARGHRAASAQPPPEPSRTS